MSPQACTCALTAGVENFKTAFPTLEVGFLSSIAVGSFSSVLTDFVGEFTTLAAGGVFFTFAGRMAAGGGPSEPSPPLLDLELLLPDTEALVSAVGRSAPLVLAVGDALVRSDGLARSAAQSGGCSILRKADSFDCSSGQSAVNQKKERYKSVITNSDKTIFFSIVCVDDLGCSVACLFRTRRPAK